MTKEKLVLVVALLVGAASARAGSVAQTDIDGLREEARQIQATPEADAKEWVVYDSEVQGSHVTDQAMLKADRELAKRLELTIRYWRSLARADEALKNILGDVGDDSDVERGGYQSEDASAGIARQRLLTEVMYEDVLADIRFLEGEIKGKAAETHHELIRRKFALRIRVIALLKPARLFSA